MTAAPFPSVAQLNGVAATQDALAALAFAGHAHFTAMQVRDGRVRGLDLHLARLRDASNALFGHALPDERIRAFLRAALERAPSALSLIATVHATTGEFVAARDDETLDVLVRTAAPSSGPAGPLDLALFEYERVLPEIKHVGEVAKTHFLRRAVAQGFDDAAFTDRHGRISEGSIWNLAFRTGDAVVWPVAGMLGGVTMRIVRRQLARLGVPQHDRELTPADIPSMAGGVVMNSWTPGIAVRRFGTATLPDSASFAALLHRAYEQEPLVAL
ncbi:aminotransferase class IV family protein [Burkholderia ubonensis]|uniref:aminotransferase class IV family protein n=1 Tax=Burkholderia ubonensis TaxID=101571 RepID=UPI00075BC431|nr:aminotransferase class IV family protein [Burkholderia ubonensis]KVW61584.1 branched-chain amino acid aminotransferase [Burkholderia ubonensis]OJB06954.1 branched-chain amino acid aminotransferase [Burkholderia ubonensis]OJB13697.1 branched-chain amino acid aminotransferase [Burkholderia ubonensis]